MKKLSNLIIVAGTGRNSGKTTLACSIIKQFRVIRPIALKISPHFHEPSVGLELLHKTPDYNIFREFSNDGHKDSSKMLVAGAISAYFIQVYDSNAGNAFDWLTGYLETEEPIVCESPALRRYIEPGIFIIADSKQIAKKKDLGELYEKADRVFELGSKPDELKLDYVSGEWVLGSGF